MAGQAGLMTGGDSGICKTIAIFAREGTNVAINYPPLERPNTENVKAVVEEGRKGLLIPQDIRDVELGPISSFSRGQNCKKTVREAKEGLGGSWRVLEFYQQCSSST